LSYAIKIIIDHVIGLFHVPYKQYNKVGLVSCSAVTKREKFTRQSKSVIKYIVKQINPFQI